MTRPSRARINLGALLRNYRRARVQHGARTLAVVKADAYGHGAVACALVLEGEADGFAVAFLEEAVALREAGITAPLLVLEGCFDMIELATARLLGCWIVVHHEEQLRMLELAPGAEPRLQAWLKLDSGMRRAGFALEQARAVHARLTNCTGVECITLMTHSARADEPDSEMTARQVAAFDIATAELPGKRSLCNSAGLLAWPVARRDWGRAGILLYGADPLPGGGHGLEPVMSFESEVFATRLLQPGDSVGYGGRFVANAPTRVGLVAVGYGDGYPRAAPDGTPACVDGLASRILGRVSMDMLTVDLTGLPATGIGSQVELWGRQVPVSRVAEAVGTIDYELLCQVRRVPRIYSNAPAKFAAAA